MIERDLPDLIRPSHTAMNNTGEGLAKTPDFVVLKREDFPPPLLGMDL